MVATDLFLVQYLCCLHQRILQILCTVSVQYCKTDNNHKQKNHKDDVNRFDFFHFCPHFLQVIPIREEKSFSMPIITKFSILFHITKGTGKLLLCKQLPILFMNLFYCFIPFIYFLSNLFATLCFPFLYEFIKSFNWLLASLCICICLHVVNKWCILQYG